MQIRVLNLTHLLGFMFILLIRIKNDQTGSCSHKANCRDAFNHVDALARKFRLLIEQLSTAAVKNVRSIDAHILCVRLHKG